MASEHSGNVTVVGVLGSIKHEYQYEWCLAVLHKFAIRINRIKEDSVNLHRRYEGINSHVVAGCTMTPA